MPGFRHWLLVPTLWCICAARCLAADPAAAPAKAAAPKSPAKVAAKAPAKPHQVFPAFLDAAKAGPDFKFQGEYAGQPDGAQIPWGVQVIALGEGKFRMVAYPGGLPGAGWSKLLTLGFDVQLNPAKTAVTGSFGYEDRKISVKIMGDKILVYDAEEGGDPLAELPRVERKSPTLCAAAQGRAGTLRRQRHAAFPRRPHDRRRSADGRRDHQGQVPRLHAARRVSPALHAHRPRPGPGNSGVYCQGRYEVQVLDSFGLKGDDNECGGIYHASKPDVNMCLPPLAWQTYDIDVTAAKYQDGKKTADARMTVRHNGVLIQDNVAVKDRTPGGQGRPGTRPHLSAEPRQPGALPQRVDRGKEVDLVRGLLVQCVGRRFPGGRKDHGLVLAGQPFPHPFPEFRHRHGIPVAFVTDELMIPRGQQVEIAVRCVTVLKFHHFWPAKEVGGWHVGGAKRKAWSCASTPITLFWACHPVGQLISSQPAYRTGRSPPALAGVREICAAAAGRFTSKATFSSGASMLPSKCSPTSCQFSAGR